MRVQIRLLACAFVFLVAGCAPERRPDLVLVAIDTLRADRLEAYGHELETAPTLASLGAEGIVYERVVASSSWTKTSMASLFTSRNPLRHGVMRERGVLPSDLTTLASALQAAGYQTLGVNSNPWLVEASGFARGFLEYESLLDPKRGFVPASEVNRSALALAGAAHPAEPLFLYVHYMDAHAPYSWRNDAGRPRVRLPGEGPVADARLEQLYRKQGLDDPAAHQRVLEMYDAGIRAADAGLSELLAGLDALGRPSPRIVAVTSDHGEGFREHGTTEHGWNIYPEVYAVPLVIAGDDLPAGVRIPSQVRSIDLAATLLGFAGASAPASFDGEPLPLTSAGAVDRTAVSSLGFGGYVPDRHYVGIVSGTHLFLRERVGGQVEFFDLRDDPGAHQDLGGEHPDARASAAFEASLVLREDEGRSEALAPETAEALRALGYLE